MSEKMSTTYVVLENERRRTTAVDLLAWAEEKVLVELVREVYKAGYVGTEWPKVTCEPVWRNLLDEWELADPEDAERWFVVASVTVNRR